MINPKMEEKVCKIFLWIMASLTLLILVAIIGNVLSRGLGFIDLEFLLETPRQMGREGGIIDSIISTFYLIIISLLIATPVGVGSAIFLTEYKKKGKLLRLIRFTTESLAGIPSIIFGIFGFAFFVIFCGMGWSILSGGLTLSLMILPTLVRTSEEAISSVPNSFREGSLAMGATRWQTISGVVIPSALPGIITGIILSTGRAVGESAAVILTAGSALGIPRTLFDPGRSMSVHLYVLAVEGISMEKAYATGAVLIMAIVLINLMANLFTARQRAKVR
ncbi:MAG: phosphate ABC transporter permease PstA [Candidatus Syntrophonatronum acetioxidans]|uniref:Phosphate transport system permease protein PstA n=1 Tax=Candidatus Syntrophonatronum acetioxidans TaxID=1795816 RepID=A0A424YG46_9FIRM|nr:MAG: phosphate ABC transporter permease PstA [Candidatus Syntrophonatronum acetioxidans]